MIVIPIGLLIMSIYFLILFVTIFIQLPLKKRNQCIKESAAPVFLINSGLTLTYLTYLTGWWSGLSYVNFTSWFYQEDEFHSHCKN